MYKIPQISCFTRKGPKQCKISIYKNLRQCKKVKLKIDIEQPSAVFAAEMV